MPQKAFFCSESRIFFSYFHLWKSFAFCEWVNVLSLRQMWGRDVRKNHHEEMEKLGEVNQTLRMENVFLKYPLDFVYSLLMASTRTGSAIRQ